MANFLRDDPVGAFNFYLTFLDSSELVGTLIRLALDFKFAGFSECTGLDATMEIFEYKEGGVNGYIHKFPTRASFGNITLKHGVLFLADDLWRWHNGFVAGEGTRKDGTIVLLDESRNEAKPAKVWKFKRGIPVKWSGPTLNAMQNNVAIESLEIAHEGLTLTVGS